MAEVLKWPPDPKTWRRARIEVAPVACRSGCPFWPADWPPSKIPATEAELLTLSLVRTLAVLSPLDREQRTAVLIHAAIIAGDEYPPPKAA